MILTRNPNQVLLFQGDSITDCQRQPHDAPANSGLGTGYVGRIAGTLLEAYPALNLAVYNRGISGNRIVDLYARWRIDAVNLKPDIISILIGVNDTWHGFKRDNGVEVPRFEQVYRMLLDYTLEQLPGVQFVLMEPFVLPTGVVEPKWEAEMALRQDVVRRLANDYSAVFVPLQEKLNQAAAASNPAYWLHDGVHPSAAGHALIARQWLEVVEKWEGRKVGR